MPLGTVAKFSKQIMWTKKLNFDGFAHTEIVVSDAINCWFDHLLVVSSWYVKLTVWNLDSSKILL